MNLIWNIRVAGTSQKVTLLMQTTQSSTWTCYIKQTKTRAPIDRDANGTDLKKQQLSRTKFHASLSK